MNTIKTLSDLIFLSALGLNIIVTLPQMITIIKTKCSQGVSAFSFIGIIFLQITTILHGYFHQDFALVVGMLLSAIINSIVVILIFNYRAKSIDDPPLK